MNKNNAHVISRGNRNIIWSCLLFWIFYSHIFWFNALSISKIKDLVELSCLTSGRIFKSSAEVFSFKINQNIIEWKPLPFCHLDKMNEKISFWMKNKLLRVWKVIQTTKTHNGFLEAFSVICFVYLPSCGLRT